MSEQIKACPFCEGEMFILNWENNHNEVVSTSARCKNCSTTVESLSLANRSREESIQAWNHRPIEDKLQARVTELEKQLEKAEALITHADDCDRVNHLRTCNCGYDEYFKQKGESK